MAIRGWFKWVALLAAAMVVLVVAAAGGGLWFISSQIAPDVKVGQPLPAIELVSFDGERLDLDGYRGRVVVLDFWSSW